jgi:hypothetical protein
MLVETPLPCGVPVPVERLVHRRNGAGLVDRPTVVQRFESIEFFKVFFEGIGQSIHQAGAGTGAHAT